LYVLPTIAVAAEELSQVLAAVVFGVDNVQEVVPHRRDRDGIANFSIQYSLLNSEPARKCWAVVKSILFKREQNREETKQTSDRYCARPRCSKRCSSRCCPANRGSK